MTHPDLWDQPAPHNGTPTSRMAAASLADLLIGLRGQVYSYVQSCPDGATCDEVEEALDLRHQTASARLNELHRRYGALVQDGTRRTRSGRLAGVYRVAR